MSEQTKSTPGPWRHATGKTFGNCVEGYSGKRLYDGDDGFRTIAMVQPCLSSDIYVDREENLAANIGLIAAAPDLLEALQRGVSDADKICTSAIVLSPNTLALMRAAIAKATGGA